MTDASLDPKNYLAFISYARADAAFAGWLHRALEHYAVPRHLVGQRTEIGEIPTRLVPIFLDRDELPSAPNLNKALNSALGQSRFLIVVCSPAAAKSRWVNEEIAYFLSIGGAERVLALIVDGEPHAADPTRECLPLLLRGPLGSSTPEGPAGAGIEPIAADARPDRDGRDRALLKLVAGLVGVGFDTLFQRDVEDRKRRARRTTGIVASVVAVVAIGIGVIVIQFQASLQRRAEALARLADRAADNGDFARAARLSLEAIRGHELPLIGFDPSPAVVALRRAAASPTQNPIDLRGHLDGVVAIAWAPDGSTLVTGSIDKTVRLWDGVNWTPLRTMAGHGAQVNVVAYAPRGRVIASASDDMSARLWDRDTGAPIAVLSGHTARITALSFSRDGSRIATGSNDHTIRVWSGDDGRLIATLSGHHDAVWAVAFSPDGSTLASGSIDGTLRLWSLAAGSSHELRGHAATIDSLSFSDDGKTLTSFAGDNSIIVWDTASTRAIATMHQGDEADASARHGSLLATGGKDGRIRLWDLNTHRLKLAFEPGNGSINSLAFSPDGTRLVSASDDGGVEQWDAALGVLLDDFRLADDNMISVAYAPDGRHVAYGSLNGRVGVLSTWTLSAGRLRSIALDDGQSRGFEVLSDILAIDLSNDGHHLLTGDGSGGVRLWDGATGELRATLGRCARQVGAVAQSPDGNRVAWACADGQVSLWDAEQGRLVGKTKDYDVNVPSIGFAPNGRWLAIPTVRGSVVLVDARTGTPLRELDDGSNIGRVVEHEVQTSGLHFDSSHLGDGASLAVSPDGRRIALGSREHGVRLFDVERGKLVATLDTGSDWTYTLAFSPDGKRLASGGSGRLRLWDVDTLERVAETDTFKARINTLRFAATGGVFAAASDDGTVRVWSASTGVEVSTLRGHEAQVADLQFVEGGIRLATLGWDRSLRLWDVATATELLRIEAQPKPRDPEDRDASLRSSFDTDRHRVHDIDQFAALLIYPSRQRIVTVLPEGTARFWNLPSALTDDLARVKRTLCTELIPGDRALLTAEEYRLYPDFNKRIGNACEDRSWFERLAAWAGARIDR